MEPSWIIKTTEKSENPTWRCEFSPNPDQIESNGWNNRWKGFCDRRSSVLLPGQGSATGFLCRWCWMFLKVLEQDMNPPLDLTSGWIWTITSALTFNRKPTDWFILWLVINTNLFLIKCQSLTDVFNPMTLFYLFSLLYEMKIQLYGHFNLN